MITQDADTFVALGQAVSLASVEGALDEQGTLDLTAALVAGILGGCMELDTYSQVHDAMARLLDHAFHGPPAAAPSNGGASPEEEDALGVYLEVVGDAWETVAWEEEACARLKRFAELAFDLSRARFGAAGWFRAPLRTGAEELLREARAAGLMVVSVQGAVPGGEVEGVLGSPGSPAGPCRVVLGWGERRTALDLVPRAGGPVS